jgi:hypothetical protein
MMFTAACIGSGRRLDAGEEARKLLSGRRHDSQRLIVTLVALPGEVVSQDGR